MIRHLPLHAGLWLFLCACVSSPVDEVSEPLRPLTESDLDFGVGTWTGALSYLDFTSGEAVAIPLDLEVSQSGPCLTLSLDFPLEPGANSSEQRCISEEGFMFHGKPVVLSGNIGAAAFFELEYEGQDNGLPVQKREVYQFSGASITIETAFRTSKDDAWTVRNTIDVERTAAE
ncbi:MAG: hypothetical protein AAF829_00985 [Pseudomonadota bacterium]